MFGKLLNLATLPIRVAAAPVKMVADVCSPDPSDASNVIGDTVRYVLTGKQDASDNPTDGFCDFDGDE